MFRQETDKQFYTWPSVVLTRHYIKKEKEEKKICAGLKASEFASPAIKAVLTPTKHGSCKERTLESSNSATWDKPHAYKKNKNKKQTMYKTLTYPTDWVSWQTS